MTATPEHSDDHRRVIGRLGIDQRRALVAQSDGPALLRIALHLGAVAATASYAALQLPLWPLAVLAEAIVLTFLFAPLHECIHGTAFRSDRLNRITAHICGFLVLLTPSHFRYFHLAHHRFTHDPDRDPELGHPKPVTLGAHIVYLSGLPAWWSRIKGLATEAWGHAPPAYVPRRGEARVRREARAYLAAYAGLLTVSLGLGSPLLLLIWVLPHLLGQPLMRAYLLAEHTGCPHSDNMLLNTRTTFTTGAIQWLAWNMPYHTEHHAYPAVPFHQLPKLHVLIQDDLGTTADGYVRFNARHIAGLAATTDTAANRPRTAENR
ncbi:MAG: fatty acid desaturase [Pseudomonadota bacterium]